VLKSLVLVAAFIVLPFPNGKPLPRARPALVRLRVVVTTASPRSEVTVNPGTIVSASALSDSRSVVERVEGNRLSFTTSLAARLKCRAVCSCQAWLRQDPCAGT
jgi:hypothetical protein